jgi:hypothetical protein
MAASTGTAVDPADASGVLLHAGKLLTQLETVQYTLPTGTTAHRAK